MWAIPLKSKQKHVYKHIHESQKKPSHVYYSSLKNCFQMMETTNNDSPPSDFRDFEINSGKKHVKYLSHIGEPLIHVGEISESDFITPSGSECSDLSSGSDDDVECLSNSVSSISKEYYASSKSKAKKTSSVKERRSGKSHSASNFISSSGSESSDSSSGSDDDVECLGITGSSIFKESSSSSISKPSKTGSVKPKRPGDFHCAVCNITVNGAQTLQAHLNGKKHRKGVAVVLPEPRYSKPKRRKLEHEKSYIQFIAEDYDEGPVPELSRVVEIRTREKRNCTYYCKVCDYTCIPITIMAHLTGYKHYLNSLKLIDPQSYKKYAHGQKKLVEHKIIRKLEKYEREHGRGLIMVEKEDDIPSCSSSSYYDEPGPSSRGDRSNRVCADSSSQRAGVDNSGHVKKMKISSREDLDTSYNDFYCMVCDAHMHNEAMWESHVKGKRHLKNKRKPKHTISTRSYEDPHATAHLMRQLKDEHRPIVGLDYIKETRGELGDQYNCYLCGSCTSSYDIIEHLLSFKHRIKFLEAADKKGQVNGISEIINMYYLDGLNKEEMVEAECSKHLSLYGSGRVMVYMTKELLEKQRRRY